MVTVILENDRLEITLSVCESFGAFTWCCGACPPFIIPYNNIRQVRSTDSLWSEVRGVRVGTGIPYVIALGSFIYSGGRDFCAVYNRYPGLVIELEHGASKYNRFIISVHDHEVLLQEIQHKMN
jgi:hypothetical protein